MSKSVRITFITFKDGLGLGQGTKHKTKSTLFSFFLCSFFFHCLGCFGSSCTNRIIKIKKIVWDKTTAKRTHNIIIVTPPLTTMTTTTSHQTPTQQICARAPVKFGCIIIDNKILYLGSLNCVRSRSHNFGALFTQLFFVTPHHFHAVDGTLLDDSFNIFDRFQTNAISLIWMDFLTFV